MSRRTKKRNKPYTGQEAKPPTPKPAVHHYRAVERGPVAEWWQAKGRAVRLAASVAAGGLLIGWLVYEFLRIAF